MVCASEGEGMNELVRDVMVETVRQARELSRIVEGVAHDGLRGQFRESFLARALQPWLPRAPDSPAAVVRRTAFLAMNLYRCFS
jgi:hypothetical protein